MKRKLRDIKRDQYLSRIFHQDNEYDDSNRIIYRKIMKRRNINI